MATNRFSVEAVFSAVDKLTKPINKMDKGVGKFVRSANRGFNKLNKGINRFVKSTVSGGAKMVGVVTATTAAMLGFQSAVTAADVESQLLSKAVQGNVDTMEALAQVIKPAGFGLDNIVDLMEEMNNKLGESAGLETITPVTESLAMMGLRFEQIKKLSPEKQFEAITNALLKMKNANEAQSAADKIFGAEGNRVIGILRERGKTLDEIVKKQQELTFRTEESRKGSIAFSSEIQSITTAVGSLIRESAGLLGADLAPFLSKITDKIKALDKAAVSKRIAEFTKQVADLIQLVINNTDTITKWFDDFTSVAKVVVGVIVGLKALSVVIGIVNIAMAANPLGLMIIAAAAAAAALTILIVKWDDIVAAVKRFGAALASNFPKSGGPIGLLIGHTRIILGLWSKIGGLISKAGSGISKASSGVSSFLGFGGDEDTPTAQNVQSVNGSDRAAAVINESRTTNSSEVTIRDETGRAEVTKGGISPGFNLKLMNSGAL